MKEEGFYFRGSDVTHTHCDRKGAHSPHRVGNYSTVRHGSLERFCRGKEGDSVAVVPDLKKSGSAEEPAVFLGTAIVDDS